MQKRLLFLFWIGFAITAPGFAFAQTGGTGGPTGGTGGGVSLTNPLGSSNVTDLLNKIIDFLILLGAPLLTIMVLVGAYQMLFSGGSQEKFLTGKKTITYAVVGFAVILVAKSIGLLVKNVLQ